MSACSQTGIARPPRRYDYARRRRGDLRATRSRRSAPRPTSPHLPADAEKVAVRMVHATGQTDLAARPRRPPAAGVGRARRAAGRRARSSPTRSMVASGVTRARLPRDNEVVCMLRDERVPELARELGHDALRGRRVAVGRPARRRGGRDRQRPDRAVPPAGDAARRGAPAGRDHRRARSGSSAPPSRSRRWRRSRTTTGSTSRSSPSAADAAARPWPRLPSTHSPRSGSDRPALRRRARPRRPRAGHPQGGPADRRPRTSWPTTRAPASSPTPGASPPA